MNDLRFAFRQLLKNPGFTAVAVLTLVPCLAISRSAGPGKSNFLFGMPPPYNQPGRHDPNHRAHPLGVRVKRSVTQQTADKVRHFILADRQTDQAVPRMTERTPSQTQIAREERRIGKGQQEGKDFFVRHSFVTQFDTDLPDGDASASQQLAPGLQDVFVEDVHVPRGYTASSRAWSRNVCRAMRTPSAIASSLMLPRHSSTMLCQAIPLATCSNTSATRIRVPRNVGCPWQIFGSATM